MASGERQHTRSAAIFAGGTMFSRVLGLVREVALTLIPMGSREAFYIAFKFPNMLREIIGEGAVNAAFVPVMSETLERESEERFRELVSAAFGAMILLLIVVTVVGVLILPLIVGEGVDSLAPVADQGPADADVKAQRIEIAQWVFPYIFFIALSVFMMAPLFSLNHYLTPSWTPSLLNLSLITACVVFRDLFVEPAYALVLGVWLGGAAQLVIQYIALGRVAGVWKPSFRPGHPGIRRMLWLLGPVIVGQAAGEANRAIDMMFAMTLPGGAVNALWNANRLIQLPTSIFGVATAVAILPSISRAGARGDNEEIRDTLLFAMRQSFFLVFPAMVGLLVLRRPIVDLLFGWNENTTDDVDQMATAILYYGFGLLAFSWIKVFVSGFYAVQNTRTPVVIASFSMVFNILLNFVLVAPLGYRGLALSTTLAFGLNAVLLYAFLGKRYGALMSLSTALTLAKSVLAAFAMAIFVYAAHSGLGSLFPDTTLMSKALRTVPPVIVGAVTYAGAAHFLGIKELRHFTDVLRRRIQRS